MRIEIYSLKKKLKSIAINLFSHKIIGLLETKNWVPDNFVTWQLDFLERNYWEELLWVAIHWIDGAMEVGCESPIYAKNVKTMLWKIGCMHYP